ncbi:HTH DNA binding protein [Bacillus phage Moonbeam]|uniref:DNA-binding protein n=1 Tax=Bacillus phage Moonbeam TaxID=1540091 RepID=A0A0A0RPH0_9CAUD|nr:HTH DNA binding protein [Bacillus phage Moonbeam]AIW03489.1 DNA-binding protein [Bacillus phage Moonbeam]
MTENVYVNLSVVDLKPAVLNFLSELAETAKESVFVTRMKDLAVDLGRDIRTVQRYMRELTSKEIIELKGRKGKGGGTVIRFNADLIQFTTSDKALINSEEPIDIDELLQTKIPKKKQEPNPNKRPRRTKTQMAEAKLLQDEKQAKIDKLNGQLQLLGGVPNWDWFQQTDNPVGNYKTYLLSRLYNRYAALFTDYHNAKVQVMKDGEAVPEVSNDYDVLGLDKVIGTSRWAQFESFRLFCEENNIDPAVYLSAQFTRSVFTAQGKNKKSPLPFVNALTSDTSYNVYLEHCDYKERIDDNCKQFKIVPKAFASDFVVQAIADAYDTANQSIGLLEYKHSIHEFFEGTYGYRDKQVELINFYDDISDKLRKNNVSYKVRNTLKKFILTQGLIQLEGSYTLPTYVILGSEHTQITLASIERDATTKEEATLMKNRLLGSLVSPMADDKTKDDLGATYLYQLRTLKETRQVLRLIQERKGLHLSFGDVQEAFEAFGKNEIPVDDFSMLDLDTVVSIVGQQTQEEPEIDLAATVEKRTVVMSGSVAEQNSIDNVLNGLQLD